MNYVKKVFQRMGSQQICSFLLYGAEDFDIENRPYKERLKIGSDSIYSRLESLYPNENELEKAISELSEALTAYEGVYMEIGMKAGARLIFQLLHKDTGD